MKYTDPKTGTRYKITDDGIRISRDEASMIISNNGIAGTDAYGNEISILNSGKVNFKQNSPTYDQLYRFKQYWDDLYGQGLDITNWHLNGEAESYDNFYDSALDYAELPKHK